jgi:drug/metabolite transporter (DMT)-like permease
MQAAVNPTNITNAITLLAALSVATERLVEIIKGAIPPLNNTAKDSTLEGFRQVALHLLAAISGFVSAWMAGATMPGVLPSSWNNYGGYVIIGFLVSGGSGFWNSILSYAKATKDIKEAQVPTTT